MTALAGGSMLRSVWLARRPPPRRRAPPAPAKSDNGLYVYVLAYALAGKGAPTPTGAFTVDAKGVGSLRVAPMQAAGAVDTFAVTLEPAAGVPAPTGAMYLAGRL